MNKIKPYEFEYEKAVVGALILSPDSFYKVKELRASDFGSDSARAVFKAISCLVEDGTFIDLLTIKDQLIRQGNEQIVKDDYLCQLVDETGTTAGLAYYVGQLTEARRRREFVRLMQTITEDLKAGISVEEVTHRIKNEGILSSTHDNGKFSALQPDQTSCQKFITTEPPAQRYIFADILPEHIVGGLIGQGGVSKSFLFGAWAVGAATGHPVLGVFKPTRPYKTLALFAEDSPGEIHRRIHFICREMFPDMSKEVRANLFLNFHSLSVMGRTGPLMELKNGNPSKSGWWHWLKDTIQNHMPLDILFLDPKSRFFGLEENDNGHNSAWVACLEELGREFNLTILFSHHASKNSNGALNQTSARGGSALVDSCRWIANIKTMDEVTAKKYEIQNHRAYVEFDVTKQNYGPHLPKTLYFKRGNNGVLLPVNLEFTRLKDMADALCLLINDLQLPLTRRELLKADMGKNVRDAMKDQFHKCTRQDIEDAVIYAVKNDMLLEEAISTSTTSKAILVVKTIPA